MIRLAQSTALLALLVSARAADPAPPAAPAPAPVASAISVRTDGPNGPWRVEGRRQRLELDPANLGCRVVSGATVWRLRPSQPGDLRVVQAGKAIQLELAAAAQKTIAPYDTGFQTGLKIELGGFRDGSEPLDLTIQLFLCLEGPDEDLTATAIASDGAARVEHCDWPSGLVSESFDATAVPFMQGMLLPKTWPEKTWLYDTLSFGRGLYQPWWGHQQGGAAMLVILETPDDGGCHFEHPAGGPTHIGPRWVNSLGRWSYPRRARLCFLEQGDHVDLAKRYRRHALATGRFVSLREKIARSPRVARLIGAPVVHTSILYHIQPESSYYKKDDPAHNDQLVTFEARARELEALASRGVTNAYVHLDGWGFRGYDNLHPDVLPPCPQAGGWEGMKRFADVCDALGFLFAIHDQYRDFYLDAPSYDERHTVTDAAGNRPLHSVWYGGRQSVLCSSLAPGHVRRNHTAILDHGVKLRGAYLDVFSVVPPDECYQIEHPVTRTDCLRFRAECLNFVRSYGGVVSSEEPSDWSVPYLDLVHHGPFGLSPGPGSGPAMGIPVPLFNLVYHDALLMPWSMERGEWGIPNKDLGFLHALANGGMPYLGLTPSSDQLERVRTVTRLHARVALLEMTRHEFLDAGWRRQRTTFADGTRVTIDLDRDEWKIEPALQQP
ncbi:MAG TPA: DUF5696 domain-containing protein [Verrucomicrobiota bacterium]|nr:DUF5696 domain-containing protein [Verrucomicrobiota bacterium]